MGFKEFLLKNLNDFLIDLEVSDLFRTEFIESVVASIYNQNNQINSFAGFITLAGTNYKAFTVEGGNE